MKKIENIEDYNISTENLEEYLFFFNAENKDWFAIFKPKAGKEENLNNEVQAFIEKMKRDDDLTITSKYAGRVEKKTENYYIYIATKTQNYNIYHAIEAGKSI